MNEVIRQYADNTDQIRKLASPFIGDVKNAEEYRKKLIESFDRIKEYAVSNEKILTENFYPLMDPNRDLSEEDMDLIRVFSSLLITPESMESLDLPMFYLQSIKLLEDANRKDDLRLKLQALDNMTMASYAMLMVTLRLSPSFDIYTKYRDAGYEAASAILEYLPPEKFAGLPDDQTKEIVLINSRYISAFFVWDDFGNEEFEQRIDRDIDMMEKSLALAQDPFYLDNAPNYDWEYHTLRVLEYITNLHEYQRHERFRKDQLEKVFQYTKMFDDFVSEHPRFRDMCHREVMDLYLSRNGHLAGMTTEEEFREEMRELYSRRQMDNFRSEWVHFNFMVQYEYIALVKRSGLGSGDEQMLDTIYKDIISYIERLPRMGVMSLLLTCLSGILRNFVECEGALTMEEMIPALMVAMHPPTFVHSLSVSGFSKKLTEYVIDRKPQLLVGVIGTGSSSEVTEQREEILDHVGKAGLLHDTGKLFITETIITYGRRLFISEFDMIKAHPDTGADIMEKHASTVPYAYAARGHHVWHDGSDGYPGDFAATSPGEKTVVDILTVADCLDASTDVVGRNYKKGKTLDEFIGELKEGRGTRYAPYVVDLFEEPDIRKEMSDMLIRIREENYSKAFGMLKEL